MTILDDYLAQGYAVVDDFLPQPDAEMINAMYTAEQNWEQQNQVRETHYQHVFKTNAACFPRGDEQYMAKFGRAKAMEQSTKFLDTYTNTVMPAIEQALSIRLRECDVRCYRLLAGDFYRTHIDDYAGDVGLIYYLNKNWVWDWGGILHICHDDEYADRSIASVLPKFNRAVLINHKIFRFPHFISSVEPWAKEPRYTIIAFNRE
jgi:Rps23 Pro-64 3,4-dihydroxylase Tpa1-like proline 4-hydroxylase